MKSLHMVTFTLVLVGALNWGLNALGYNVVEMLLGSMPQVVTVVYLLIGASAVYLAATHMNDCKICGKK